MTRDKDNKILSVVHPVYCGIEVHKKIVIACVLNTKNNGKGEKVIRDTGEFNICDYLRNRGIH